MNSQRGFVLVIVLMAVVLLTGLVTVFINEVYLEIGSNRSSVDTTQGSLFAAAAIAGVHEQLKQAHAQRSYTALTDLWAKPILLDDPQGQLRISIEEENSKLNLNVLALPNGTYNEAYHAIAVRLFRQLKLPTDPIDAIADWIDEDATPHPGGAEADWYLARKQPIRPRNKPLLTLEEARRIRGVAELFDQLHPFVTVYGDQPAGAPAATININTAPRELLVALDDRITVALADRIIAHRTETPFRYPAELAQVPGMEQITTTLLTRISVKGTVYRIRAEGIVNGSSRAIEVVSRINGGAEPSILYWREY
ncbi:MAG: type II secretion system minor pseudopilin GspK [Trichlorobacter sp.]